MDPFWPTKPITERKKVSIQIRPYIRFDEKQILEETKSWYDKEIRLADLYKRDFKEFINNLDRKRIEDSKSFYDIINKIVKFKKKQFLVGGVTDINGDVALGQKATDIITRYMSNKFGHGCFVEKIPDDSIRCEINLEYAFEKLSKDKASGLDGISGVTLKKLADNLEMKEKIRK